VRGNVGLDLAPVIVFGVGERIRAHLFERRGRPGLGRACDLQRGGDRQQRDRDDAKRSPR
jgi:hypothetical protein